MRKAFPSPTQTAIIINYHIPKRTFLTKNVIFEEQPTVAWIYTDEANPYKIFSYLVSKDSPDELKKLVDLVPAEEIVGLEEIIKKLNEIDWTPDLFKIFIKKCRFSFLHVSNKNNLKKEITLLKEMTKYSTSFINDTTSVYRVLGKRESSSSTKLFISNIANYYHYIYSDIFREQMKPVFFHFSHFPESKESYDMKLTNRVPFSFEDMDRIRTEVNNDMLWIEKELTEFLYDDSDNPNDPTDYMDLYDNYVKPLYSSKLYPLLSLIFKEIKTAEMTGSAKEAVQNIYQNFGLHFDADNDPRYLRNYMQNITFDIIARRILTYSLGPSKWPLLKQKMKQMFKKLHKKFIKNMNAVEHLDLKKAEKVFKKMNVNILRNHSMTTPVIDFLGGFFARKVSEEYNAFLEEDISTRLMGPDLDNNFVKKNLYFASLLGGNFPGADVVVNPVLLFKLNMSKSKVSAQNMLLV
jgi:Icc-related predicted phosphoesterase